MKEGGANELIAIFWFSFVAAPSSRQWPALFPFGYNDAFIVVINANRSEGANR